MTDARRGATRRLLLASAAAGLSALWMTGRGRAQTGRDELTPDEHQALRAKAEAYRGEFRIPGLSLAIARGGRLVYAQGFGIAAEGVPVQPHHLFRIASVSKPITAVAVFTLIEQGRLRLDDRVFGPGGILAAEFAGRRRISPIDDITIAHLLTHTSGGWPNDGRDPMFTSPQTSALALIGWTIENVPLSAAPGTRHAYSNFGYCVLGRVIEKVAQQAYETYVRSVVLRRCGVTTMEIAGNTYAERRPGEVSYYPDGNPYGMNVRRMDSHGGWIASAADLVKFLTHVDGFSNERAVLNIDTIKTMTTPLAINPGYAYGWSVNPRNYWHNGSLPGTTAIMVRTQSGFCWAALANARHGNSVAGIDRLMWDMAKSVAAWRP